MRVEVNEGERKSSENFEVEKLIEENVRGEFQKESERREIQKESENGVRMGVSEKEREGCEIIEVNSEIEILSDRRRDEENLDTEVDRESEIEVEADTE